MALPIIIVLFIGRRKEHESIKNQFRDDCCFGEDAFQLTNVAWYSLAGEHIYVCIYVDWLGLAKNCSANMEPNSIAPVMARLNAALVLFVLLVARHEIAWRLLFGSVSNAVSHCLCVVWTLSFEVHDQPYVSSARSCRRLSAKEVVEFYKITRSNRVAQLPACGENTRA